MKEKNNGIITKKIAKEAILQSFKKLNPKDMIKNPVMFVAYVGNDYNCNFNCNTQ